ncbi:hypothetical protein HYH02_006497 [Chlamydomonas schloesseri]|uniref:Proline dehydrogenase n=1 Tax=Chlamydomonas schloesseri TaxID=2026947 RepID=A0A835WJM5_9CHLO|nr:hypothetical protein HYH02_006497 [Chlamydomonas schloesseri]|eukprot:KAG2448607.1 hypothetical protein HYH02_006497 [Chlamydomonas schloesseri]
MCTASQSCARPGKGLRWRPDDERSSNAPVTVGTNFRDGLVFPSLVNRQFAFLDHRAVYEHKSTEELVRSLVVLGLCSSPLLVRHSEALLDALPWVREALYKHFSVGHAPADVWGRMNSMRANGVQAIMDFAEEDSGATALSSAASLDDAADAEEAEERYERRVAAFLASIDTAATLQTQGFAAVKLTALADPAMLEALALLEAQAAQVSEAAAEAQDAGQGQQEQEQGLEARLAAAQQAQLAALMGRLDRLGVKLMIDAELSHLRPAIDRLAHQLMARHNRSSSSSSTAAGGGDGAVIFISYQAYLRDVQLRLQRDLERAERQGYVLGAKLVGGVYLHLERRRAAERGEPAPVWDTAEDTYAAYDGCLDALLCAVKAGRAELMVGSHNQGSVQTAVTLMARLGLDPEEAPVYFGQLLGMADNISFTLGQHGYKTFKYCPHGEPAKLRPYLSRRVLETQYSVQGGRQDLRMVQAELWRRISQDPAGQLAQLFGSSRSGSSNSSSTARGAQQADAVSKAPHAAQQ